MADSMHGFVCVGGFLINVEDRVAHCGGYHDALPHAAGIWTQCLEAENIPVLARPASSLDMSQIEHVWDAPNWRKWQRQHPVMD